MYLTYEEYRNMGGELDATTFVNAEFEAESIIDDWTFNRLAKETTYSLKVQQLMYKLIQVVTLKDQSMTVGQSVDGATTFHGAVTSQSNDGFSTSFNALSASDALEVSKQEIDLLIRRYLGAERNSLGHKLLYRGVYPDE